MHLSLSSGEEAESLLLASLIQNFWSNAKKLSATHFPSCMNALCCFKLEIGIARGVAACSCTTIWVHHALYFLWDKAGTAFFLW